MTIDDFRRLALAQPESTEGAHMRHPDFRINGKIFATLHYPDDQWGMVKLSPEQQDSFVRDHPATFAPVKGAWGRQGCTVVCLAKADIKTVEQAMHLAWRNHASPPPRKTARKQA